MNVYIITDPEAGWDCIDAAYLDIKEAIIHCLTKSLKNTDDWEKYIDKLPHTFHSDDYKSGLFILNKMKITEKFEE